MVIGDDEHALAAIEHHPARREWEGEGTTRCRDSDVKNDRISPASVPSVTGTVCRKAVTYVGVESVWRVMKKPVPVSGFLR